MSWNSSQPIYVPWQLNAYTTVIEGNAVGSILMGVYLTIAAINLSLLQKKKNKILILYSSVQLALTMVYFILSLYKTPERALAMFPVFGFPSPDILSPWYAIVMDVAYMMNVWTSDAFLLYRCGVICLWDRYALAIPGLLYLATVGSSFAWFVVSTISGARYSTLAVHVSAICYWSLSTTMNICTSCLICARLLMYRKEISESFVSRHGGFYLGYIAMTLESAMLYTVFAIAVLVVYALNSTLEYAFIPILGGIQSISPSLIIYRIARGISFETDEFVPFTTGSTRFPSFVRPQVTTRLVHEDISDDSSTIHA